MNKKRLLMLMGGMKDSLTKGLLAYWKLDEAGGEAIDTLGVYNLSDTTNTVGVPGKVGNARQFVASNTQFLYSDMFEMGDIDFTISFWIKPATISTQLIVTNINTSATSGNFGIYLSNSNINMALYSSTESLVPVLTATDFGNLSAENWYHIVATRNKITTAATLFVNNISTSVNIAGTLGTYKKFRVGRRSFDSTLYYNGLVDELGVWNRVLTNDEITRLYNA